ncbi:protein FAM221B [Marmota monax]|uniref:protein FAM221B n=1 Tax=Marmota monax TaxID=9995 RepID=UPI0026F0D5E9|nr:protein FAM221B [Marmota monax]
MGSWIEADKVTEEPHTTMDAKKHPSSKDPSTEDLQEPPLSETTLEPSISQIPLEAQASESLLEHSVSEPPLDKSTFKTLLEPHTSENPLEPSIYVTSLKESASMVPLEAPTFETHNSEVPEKHIAFQSSPVNQLSSSDTLSDDDLSESSSTEVSWTRTSSQELFPKHFVSGPSAQNHMDTSTMQKEDSGENKEGMDTNDITAQTAHPEHQLGKKKEKKGVGRYIGSPVVPAKQAELMDLTKEMEREKSGAQLNHLFQWEKDASLNAIQTGLYIGWRCPHYLWDCFLIGDESKCFCGHLLREHHIISDITVPCNVSQCRCLMFCFIPSRPEEVGEFWLKRRATFDPKAWRAQCRCKHSHEEHAATGTHPCRHRGCGCNNFESNFLCAACDWPWEEHETFFETQETRRRGGRPHGAEYVTFADMPVLQETILNSSDFEALQMQRLPCHPSPHPSSPAFPSPHRLQPGPPSDRHT